MLIEWLGPPRTPAVVRFPSGAGPAWSSPPLSLTPPGPLVSARTPARVPLAADLISAVGF
jgi:hypothetical protein